MKSIQYLLVISFSILSFKTHACSPVFTSKAHIKEAMIIILKERFTDSTQLLHEEDLTEPEYVFPNGLEPDCTGLEEAYTISNYKFNEEHLTHTCVFKGEIRMKGLYLQKETKFDVIPGETMCDGSVDH